MATPIQKITATQAVVESLKNRIRDGEFRPGDQLPSEQLMLKEYDVSRLTLREALANLAALGIIEVRHGKGAFLQAKISVPALGNVLIPMFPMHDLNRMNDLVEARNLIESEIAATVAQKRTDQQIAKLKTLLAHDDRVFKSAELFAERDYAFHLALAEMAGNHFFYAMYQALHIQIKTFLVQYARSIMDREEALNRHQPILNAIIDQNIEEARQLAREHASICASYINDFETADRKG
jgi:GntR family transcriptional regulator, transcriptional repressor for pyruvate dehydrogenase complex